MGGAVGPVLAAAVSNAGGLGMLAPWSLDIDVVRQQIRETHALTSRPFGVNLNVEFPQEDRLTVSGVEEPNRPMLGSSRASGPRSTPGRRRGDCHVAIARADRWLSMLYARG
jgi:NAD(P)H-dependent flavin oxidoreductase YrpB (nitropropane dioxygenase family)